MIVDQAAINAGLASPASQVRRQAPTLGWTVPCRTAHALARLALQQLYSQD